MATESYSKGDTDFRTQLGKLNARRPDILVLSSLVGEAIPVLQQAREIGITVPIVGGNGFNSPNVLAEREGRGGRAHRGKRLVHRQHRAEEQGVRRRLPREVRNATPTSSPPRRMTGCTSWPRAIRNAGSADRAAIRDALAKIRDQDGALGSLLLRREPRPGPPQRHADGQGRPVRRCSSSGAVPAWTSVSSPIPSSSAQNVVDGVCPRRAVRGVRHGLHAHLRRPGHHQPRPRRHLHVVRVCRLAGHGPAGPSPAAGACRLP